MIIKDINLLNVDFDSNYDNVLDFYSDDNTEITSDDVKIYLISKFDRLGVVNILNKGINISSDKTFNITIKRQEYYDFEEIHNKKCNYIILSYETKDLYAFITNVTDIGNETVILHCQYDVWMNNIIEIYSHTKKQLSYNVIPDDNNYGTTEQAHFISYFKSDGLNALPIDYKLYLTKPNSKVEYTTQPFFKSLDNENYNLLYLKLICSDEISVKFENEGSTKDIVVKSVVGSLPIYYIPIGLRSQNNGYVNFNIRYTVDYLVSTMTINNEITTINSIPRIKSILSTETFKKISPYIISAELTFNVPIDYTLTKEDNKIIVSFVDCKVVSLASNILSQIMNDLLLVNPNVRIDTTELPNNFNSRDLSVNTQVTISKLKQQDRIKFIDSIFNVFPFNYKAVKIGNNLKIINSPSPKYDRAYQLFKLDTDTLGLKLIYFNSNTDEQFIEQLEFDRQIQNTEVSFSKDSLQYYLNTKGSQAKNSVYTATLSGGVNALGVLGMRKPEPTLFALNPIAMVVNSINSAIMYSSAILDAENSPNDVTKSLYRGEIDFDYIDLPLVVKYTFDKDDLSVNQLENFIHYYGYEYSVIRSPFIITKRYFDYVKMNNIHITIGDGFDREKLIQIFNNGVTKNHIKVKNGNIILNSIKTISNKNINNYDIWLDNEEV